MRVVHPKLAAAAVVVLGALAYAPSRTVVTATFCRTPRLLLLPSEGARPLSAAERLDGIANRGAQWWCRLRIRAASRLKAADQHGFERWATPYGDYWVPQGGGKILPMLLARRQRNLYGPVAPGSIVLDCGAHVGVYTRKALAQGAALVVAIEPVPENLECLRRNLEPEVRAHRVIVYPKGVWNREDVLPMRTSRANSETDSFVQASSSGQLRRFAVTTIDRLVAELALPRVDRIKMNIEGAEQEALAGARLTLSKYHPALAIAADHMPDDSYAIPALVNRSWPGYRSVSAGSLREVAGHVVPEGASLQPGHRPQPIETSHEPLANHEKAGRITAGYAARCRLILGENGSHVG